MTGLPGTDGRSRTTLYHRNIKEHKHGAKADLLEILDNIYPGELDYQEWVSVGMALKQEGYTAEDWDRWSQRDPARYHSGECFRKWNSFLRIF